MQPDVTGSSRRRGNLAAWRARIIGTAFLGMAVVAFWLGRLAGTW